MMSLNSLWPNGFGGVVRDTRVHSCGQVPSVGMLLWLASSLMYFYGEMQLRIRRPISHKNDGGQSGWSYSG